MSDDPARYFGQPSDPTTQVCAFCDNAARHVDEIRKSDKAPIGLAQYIYSCAAHRDLAAEAVWGRRVARRPKPSQNERLFEPPDADAA